MLSREGVRLRQMKDMRRLQDVVRDVAHDGDVCHVTGDCVTPVAAAPAPEAANAAAWLRGQQNADGGYPGFSGPGQ